MLIASNANAMTLTTITRSIATKIPLSNATSSSIDLDASRTQGRFPPLLAVKQ